MKIASHLHFHLFSIFALSGKYRVHLAHRHCKLAIIFSYSSVKGAGILFQSSLTSLASYNFVFSNSRERLRGHFVVIFKKLRRLSLKHKPQLYGKPFMEVLLN